MKKIIALTSSNFNELRRDGIGYTVKRVFNHIPREGHMCPDEVMIVPDEGGIVYQCSWTEWRALCSGQKPKTIHYAIMDNGQVVFERPITRTFNKLLGPIELVQVGDLETLKAIIIK